MTAVHTAEINIVITLLEEKVQNAYTESFKPDQHVKVPPNVL